MMLRSAQSLWLTLNDHLLGISTGDRDATGAIPAWRGSASQASCYRDNLSYSTPDYYYIHKVLKILQPGSEDVVYDIGCGKGRFLCRAARLRVKKCVGIELLPELAEIASENANQLRGRVAPIEIRCIDAARADVSGGTIYFLFNPFGAETLATVLDNIHGSLVCQPRSVRIVYYNPACANIVESAQWLRCYCSFRTFNRLEVRFYRSV